MLFGSYGGPGSGPTPRFDELAPPRVRTATFALG